MEFQDRSVSIVRLIMQGGCNALAARKETARKIKLKTYFMIGSWMKCAVSNFYLMDCIRARDVVQVDGLHFSRRIRY
jgi:hypothetical protein